jgi:hypothetical protein
VSIASIGPGEVHSVKRALVVLLSSHYCIDKNYVPFYNMVGLIFRKLYRALLVFFIS